MHEVFHDKFLWIQDYYPDIRVHFGPYSEDKQLHAKPGDILVDDRTSNCLQWRSAGGLAVQVHSGRFQEALDQLYTLFADAEASLLIDWSSEPGPDPKREAHSGKKSNFSSGIITLDNCIYTVIPKWIYTHSPAYIASQKI